MSWRFARRPWWIVRHVLVAALVIVMITLGFWQLRRLDERRDVNDRIEARQEAPVVAIAELVEPDDRTDGDAVAEAEHRRATAVGTYQVDDTVIVANRSLNGGPGGWVLTPLELEDGTAVIVNRGFLGFDEDGELVPPEPPSGEVEVTGLVRESQTRGRFGPTDPAEGTLDTLARADLDRYQAQLTYEILPVYLQLLSSSPPQPRAATGSAAILPLEQPSLDDGPHLGYAVQWFIFSTIALIGYPLLLVRVARQEAAAEAADRPGEPDELDRELEDLLRSER